MGVVLAEIVGVDVDAVLGADLHLQHLLVVVQPLLAEHVDPGHLVGLRGEGHLGHLLLVLVDLVSEVEVLEFTLVASHEEQGLEHTGGGHLEVEFDRVLLQGIDVHLVVGLPATLQQVVQTENLQDSHFHALVFVQVESDKHKELLHPDHVVELGFIDWFVDLDESVLALVSVQDEQAFGGL